MTKPVTQNDLFQIMNSYEDRFGRLERANFFPRTTAIEWAPQGGVPDVNLYRNANAQLQTDQVMKALEFYAVRGSTAGQAFEATVTGDANNRFAIYAGGQHEWGPGPTIRDTSMYRYLAGVLGVANALAASPGATGHTQIGPVPAALSGVGSPSIQWGPTTETYMYKLGGSQIAFSGYFFRMDNGPSRMNFYASSIGTWVGHANANNDYNGADSYLGFLGLGAYHIQNGYSGEFFQVDNQYVTPALIKLGGGVNGISFYIGRASGSTGVLQLKRSVQFDTNGYIYSYLNTARYVSGYQSYVAALYCDAFTNYSDDRAKEDATPVADAVAKIGRIKGVKFKWKRDRQGNGKEREGQEDMGILAQDVLKVFPELVRPKPKHPGDIRENPDDDDELMVNYLGLVAPLIESVRELDGRLTAIEDKKKGK